MERDAVRIKPREKAKVSAKLRPPISNERGEAEAQESSIQQAPAGVQPVQPEDPHLTGASSALQRELLGRNTKGLRKGQKAEAQPAPDSPVGLHATGTNVDLNKKK